MPRPPIPRVPGVQASVPPEAAPRRRAVRSVSPAAADARSCTTAQRRHPDHRHPAAPRGPNPALTRCPAPAPGSLLPSVDRKWAADAVRQVRKERAPSVSSLGLSEVGASRWSLVPGDCSRACAGPREAFSRATCTPEALGWQAPSHVYAFAPVFPL